MPSGERFAIATADFVDRDEAAAFFGAMLRRHAVGARIGPADAMHLRALLERHPDRDAKIGCGAAGFTVMRTDHGAPCFGVVRTDGTRADFSVRRCLRYTATTPLRAVKKALRLAVRPDLERLRPGGTAAAACEEGAGFGGIVKAFLEARGIDPGGLALAVRPGRVTPELTDEALVADFRAFHLSRFAHAA